MAVETLQPGIEATRTLIVPQDNQAVNEVEPHTDFPQYTVIQIDHRTTPELVPSKLSPIAKKLVLKGEPDGLIFLPIGESEDGYMIPVKVRIGDDLQEAEQLRDGSNWHVYPEVYSVPQAVYSVDQNTYSLVPTPHRIIVNSETLDHFFLEEDRVKNIVHESPSPLVKALSEANKDRGWVNIGFEKGRLVTAQEETDERDGNNGKKQVRYPQILVEVGRDKEPLETESLVRGSSYVVAPERYPFANVVDQDGHVPEPSKCYYRFVYDPETLDYKLWGEQDIEMMREVDRKDAEKADLRSNGHRNGQVIDQVIITGKSNGIGHVNTSNVNGKGYASNNGYYERDGDDVANVNASDHQVMIK